MTRQQAIFIITLNAIISLAISLLVVQFASPPTALRERLPRGALSTAPTTTGPTLLTQAPPAGQPAPPGTPTPIIHVVRSGDTLLWIAEKYNVSKERIMEENHLTDPDVLVVGQELIIPPLEAEQPVEVEAASLTPTGAGPSSTATPTATPAEEEIHLAITKIVAPGRWEAEVLVLTNSGRDVRLQGWTLSNGKGQVYTFPNLTLYRGNSIRIWTVKGRNTASDLYWGLDSAAWGPEVEAATLTDPQGEVQDIYELP